MLNFIVTVVTLVSSVATMVVFSDAYPIVAPAIQLVWFIWLVFYALAIMREINRGNSEVS